MRSMRVFHHTFAGAGTKTFNLNAAPHSVLVKNMSDNAIKFSWGQDIDNNDYSDLPGNLAELFEYDPPRSEDLYVTIEATGAGKIEIRIIDD